MWGNVLRVLKVYTRGIAFGKEMQKEDCWSAVMKESCGWQTLGFIRQTKGKSLSVDGCETEIDFVLVRDKYRKYIRNVQVIPWELQHKIMVIDLDKKILNKVVRKQWIVRRKIWKLNENQKLVKFEKKSERTSKHRHAGFVENFQACHEVCGKKSRRDQKDMKW